MKLYELDEAGKRWISERPPQIQEMCAKWPPNLLYRLKNTGERVTLCSYAEDGTVTVTITGEYNLVDFDKEVFGVDPNQLEECDRPGPGEPVGTLLTTPEQVREYIEKIRPAILASRRANPADPFGKPKQ
jgi:hypothetical protein